MCTLRVLMSGLALVASGAPTGDSLRRELEAEYAANVAGFRNNDPEPWLRRLTPDFTLTLFNGQIQDREWVVRYVRNNAKTFKVLTLTMTIQRIESSGLDVVATVEQKSSRSFVDEAGVKHTLDVGAIQRETWTKSSTVWRLKHVQEKELLYLRKDGK